MDYNDPSLKKIIDKITKKYDIVLRKLAKEESNESYFTYTASIIKSLHDDYHLSYDQAIKLFDRANIYSEIGHFVMDNVRPIYIASQLFFNCKDRRNNNGSN